MHHQHDAIVLWFAYHVSYKQFFLASTAGRNCPLSTLRLQISICLHSTAPILGYHKEEPVTSQTRPHRRHAKGQKMKATTKRCIRKLAIDKISQTQNVPNLYMPCGSCNSMATSHCRATSSCLLEPTAPPSVERLTSDSITGMHSSTSTSTNSVYSKPHNQFPPEARRS